MKSLIEEYENVIIEFAHAQGAPEGTEIEIALTDRIVIGLMLCERLDKIGALLEFADNLAGIEESLHKLAACIDNTKGYGHRLCIAGDITTSNC